MTGSLRPWARRPSATRLVPPGSGAPPGQAATERPTLADPDRRRIAQDLQGVGHNLFILDLCLQRISADLKNGRTDPAELKLRETAALVGDAVASVRRAMLDLGPPAADGLRPQEALRSYALQFLAHTGIAVHVHVREHDVPERIGPAYESALHRTLQAALSNVLEHSRARNVLVTLEAAPGPAVVLAIADDGVGFATDRVPERDLVAVRRMTEVLGGRFVLESWPERGDQRARGTRLEVSLPLPPVHPL
jgi:signal transduction histidine kinase